MTIATPGRPASAERATPAPPLRLAVVGLGHRGIAHTLALAAMERTSLLALADPRSSARRNASGMGLRVPAYPTLERLLARQSPDAVFVCAPVAARAALAMRALEGGAAVFIERPISLDYDVAARVIDEAGRLGLPLLCSHPIVHQPVFARALADVAAGTIGAVRRAHASVYVSRVFSAAAARRMTHGQGGGVVAYVALDALFLLTRMLGVPIEGEARAIRLYGDHEDEVHARLRLPSGCEISLDCSWSVPGYARSGTVIELEGDRGHLLVSDDALEIDTSPAAHQRWIDADLPQPALFDVDGEARGIEDAAFVEWVLGGAAPPAANREALHVHALMRALQVSAREGGRVVPVSEETTS